MEATLTETPKTDFLKPHTAAALLQLSYNNFWKKMQKGDIPGAFKIGKSWRIDRERFLAGIRELQEKVERKEEG